MILIGEGKFLTINSNTISNGIFANRIITDFSESVGNRVLSVDDVSNTFNSKQSW